MMVFSSYIVPVLFGQRLKDERDHYRRLYNGDNNENNHDRYDLRYEP